MSDLKTVFTTDAPVPAGHYSQAIVHGPTIYIAGQLPIDKDGNKLSTGSIEEQTKLVLNNIEAILLAAGSDKNHVLQMTLYVVDIKNWGKINRVYADFFGDHKPARAVVPVPELNYGLGLEVQVVAAVI
ncbi:MAG: Rid family detoxifying hydrolase [Bacteroidota bacterium]